MLSDESGKYGNKQGEPMFNRIAEMLAGFSSFLENFFVAALRAIQAFTRFMAEALETIWAFIDIFGFLIIQLSIQLAKLSIFFIPGLAMSMGLYYGRYIIGSIGIVYIAALLLAILGFRTIAKENGSIEEMPENWLWYFPYSWLKNGFLRKKLTDILQINKETVELSKTCDIEKTTGKAFHKLVLSVGKKIKFIRRNIKEIQSTVPINLPNNQFQEEFENRVGKYLNTFISDFSHLKEELESMARKIKQLDGTSESSNQIEKEIDTGLKNLKGCINSLERIQFKE